MTEHKERAHSKYSASGADRWLSCPASVALSEGLPDKSSPWAEEGTQAHEALENVLTGNHLALIDVRSNMLTVVLESAAFITTLYHAHASADFLVEQRVHLDFIHPEMFGTFDSAIVDHFGTLHVFDFKYGQGHAVSPVKNWQMIFYGVGLAYRYGWNFQKVRLWIIQPRIRGYDGPVFWDVGITDLKEYAEKLRAGVERVEREPHDLNEGAWCHWCRAKKICPLKTGKRTDEMRKLFESPIDSEEKEYGKNEGGQKSEADWRKEKSKGGKRKKENERGKTKAELKEAKRKTNSNPFDVDPYDYW